MEGIFFLDPNVIKKAPQNPKNTRTLSHTIYGYVPM